MAKARDAAYEKIRDMIRSGLIPPGAQLREEELAASCGISRTPVREALRRLQSECFVRRTATNRTFVANWSRDEVDDAFFLRGMLEAYAAERAAVRIDENGLNELRAANQGVAEAAAGMEPDLIAFLNYNHMFHRVIIDAADSSRLSDLVGMIVEQPVVAKTARQYDRTQMLQSHIDHEEVILALSSRDPTWARAAMISHIRRAWHIFSTAVQEQSLSPNLQRKPERGAKAR